MPGWCQSAEIGIEYALQLLFRSAVLLGGGGIYHRRSLVIRSGRTVCLTSAVEIWVTLIRLLLALALIGSAVIQASAQTDRAVIAAPRSGTTAGALRSGFN